VTDYFHYACKRVLQRVSVHCRHAWITKEASPNSHLIIIITSLHHAQLCNIGQRNCPTSLDYGDLLPRELISPSSSILCHACRRIIDFIVLSYDRYRHNSDRRETNSANFFLAAITFRISFRATWLDLPQVPRGRYTAINFAFQLYPPLKQRLRPTPRLTQLHLFTARIILVQMTRIYLYRVHASRDSNSRTDATRSSVLSFPGEKAETRVWYIQKRKREREREREREKVRCVRNGVDPVKQQPEASFPP